ncbi:hypothetical protein Megvenef_01473 [Candidatus Megaera venefica]|uniref:SDR family NAD(P)-dependent oxidoreductase n=1 Tax=Candidatus Megaera venefica TaxID=2055910 RepID=A0ABU5NE94_9RICK|nr:hypothetical protein [Candidatus Megaera venefica]MEA0971494.1 hypothetical protein [Candidatus Megaera venefica]
MKPLVNSGGESFDGGTTKGQMNLLNHTVFITGGSSGIGLALAKKFMESKCVFILYHAVSPDALYIVFNLM